MQKNHFYSFLVTALIMTSNALAQTNKPVVDYLKVPGPIVFENKEFYLSWSSHPSADFYKHEYIAKADDANQYKTMVLIDVVTGGVNIRNIVAAKVSELKTMKESNPVINYEIINNPATGEYLLDFLVTANAPDGSIKIAERNVYRYKSFIDKTGRKGVVLFGISTRAYGAAVTSFFGVLKKTRKDLVNKLAKLKTPEITILK